MSTAISRDGTKIAYDKTGAGPAVILVDGALGYREHYGQRPLAVELSKHFTAIAYDRRGRGESTDTQPYSVEREIEDIEALIDAAGAPVCLFGFSSGSVLALRAAARLGHKVARLAVFEPPLNADDGQAKQEFAEFAERMSELLGAGKRGEALTLFFANMLPPEIIAEMRKSPDWPVMEAVAPTLRYDILVMGDGAVPVEAARAAAMPALVLDGGESEDFKHQAADDLAEAMPNAQRATIEGENTRVSPEALAPILVEFFEPAKDAIVGQAERRA